MTLDARSLSASEIKSRPSRRFARALAAIAVVVGGATALASNACVAAEGKFYISAEASIMRSSSGASSCSNTMCGAQTVYQGRGDQQACYLVTSGLIPRLKTDTNHVESNRIIVSEVDIEVFGPGGALVDSFTRAADGEVNPSTTDNSMPFTIVRLESLQSLKIGDQAVIGIILKGRTTGGIDVETPEYFAPVYVATPPAPSATATSGMAC